ncbi:MAG: hypothetical protein PsegKO_34700 [Pseudohongiellaceae bacterium]
MVKGMNYKHPARPKKIWVLIGAVCCAATLSACSSQPKSAQAANTAEILFGSNVQSYIEDQRAVLRDLRHRLDTVDRDLLIDLGELKELDDQLRDSRNRANLSGRERDRLRQELDAVVSEKEALLDKSMDLRRQFDSLAEERSRATNQRAAISQKIDFLNAEMDDLEEESAFLDKVIERSIRVRASQHFVE